MRNPFELVFWPREWIDRWDSIFNRRALVVSRSRYKVKGIKTLGNLSNHLEAIPPTPPTSFHFFAWAFNWHIFQTELPDNSVELIFPSFAFFSSSTSISTTEGNYEPLRAKSKKHLFIPNRSRSKCMAPSNQRW